MPKVFVDPLMNNGWKMRGKHVKNCHMFVAHPDHLEALHTLAQSIGLKREWFQDGRNPHYDLTPSKREAAIKAGAQPVEMREAVKIWKAFRGELT